MEVLRFLYVTGSHLIHATAHGLRLTLAPAGFRCPSLRRNVSKSPG